MKAVVDIVIIGAGMAGLCASVEAAAAGASVIVLEKQPQIGGSSLLSGCFMAFAGTEFQKQHGITDSADSLIEDMLQVGQYKNDRTLVETYGQHQLETYNWLVNQGVQFIDCQAVSGHTNPRGHTIVPKQAIDMLKSRAIEHGAKIYTDAVVTRLEKRNERVEQVHVTYRGHSYVVEARKGIIIASGGFSRSEDLLEHFAPGLTNTIRLGGVGNTGDGIRLACEQGAWLRDTPYLKGTYGFHPSSTNDNKRQAHTFYKGGIIVNEQGERFVNESISYKLLGDAALQQSDQSTFQIWDQTVMDKGVKGDALYDFASLEELGLMERSESIEALATIIGVPPSSLQQTISSYNEAVDTGNDVLGRTTLTHTFGKPTKIRTAPFYAMNTSTAMLATYAGVTVNEKAEVLNPFNESIPGLFAAGEVVGGFHGAGYMTGSSLGKAAIFGRIAAKQAIQQSNVEEALV